MINWAFNSRLLSSIISGQQTKAAVFHCHENMFNVICFLHFSFLMTYCVNNVSACLRCACATFVPYRTQKAEADNMTEVNILPPQKLMYAYNTVKFLK